MGDRRQASDPDDPNGVIRESYRIEGITASDCRSIFLDWALSLPEGADASAAARRLLERRGTGAPDHPMTAVLEQAQRGDGPPVRRGGRQGRRRPKSG